MATALPNFPRVSEQAFIGVAWGGVGLACVFLILRLGARVKYLGRLFIDDFFVVAAFLMFLTSTIIWQIYKGLLFENLLVSSGKLFPIPDTLASDTETYLRASVAVIIFFYSSLWFVKFSFLAFFRRLGLNVRGQKALWWTITAITVASWIASLGTLEYDCLIGNFTYLAAVCTSKSKVEFQRRTLMYNMAMDVITDAMIISIPFNLLWRVQISVKQKLALLGLFSLTIIVMIFAIVRVAVVSTQSFEPDESWLYMWSSIEQTVSIIVACLASFRVLFTKQEGSTGPRPTKYYEHGNSFSRRGLVKNGIKSSGSKGERIPDRPSNTDIYHLSTLKNPDNTYNYDPESLGSRDNIVPHAIHVKREFQTHSGPGV